MTTVAQSIYGTLAPCVLQAWRSEAKLPKFEQLRFSYHIIFIVLFVHVCYLFIVYWRTIMLPTVLYHSSVSSSCMIRIFLNMFRAWLLPCLMYSSRTRCSHIPRLFGESLGMRLHAREGRVWLNVTAKLIYCFLFFFSMDKCSYW